MLNCKIDIRLLNDQNILCGACNVCAGKSKIDYPFEKDLRNSTDLVEELKAYIYQTTGLICDDTKIDKNPDINVFDKYGNVLCRVEAKYLEGQAFMKSKAFINLYPKEALVIDEPKLDSYVNCKNNDRYAGKEIPIFVVWKFDKPCADVGGIAVFQEIDVLEQIRQQQGRTRAYERKTAYNDYNNGAKMGVTKKYHFSIRECQPIEELPYRINILQGANHEVYY